MYAIKKRGPGALLYGDLVTELTPLPGRGSAPVPATGGLLKGGAV